MWGLACALREVVRQGLFMWLGETKQRVRRGAGRDQRRL